MQDEAIARVLSSRVFLSHRWIEGPLLRVGDINGYLPQGVVLVRQKYCLIALPSFGKGWMRYILETCCWNETVRLKNVKNLQWFSYRHRSHRLRGH